MTTSTSKSRWNKKVTKRIFNKILKPRCFGLWDCLIHPNEDNPYYSSIGIGTIEDIMKVCPYIEECVNVKNPNSTYILYAKKQLERQRIQGR